MSRAGTYVLPLKASVPRTELTAYLAELARHTDVVVVDGSAPEVFAAHARAFGAHVTHLPVDDDLRFVFGKVNGVLTGLRHAADDRVVIADDDVRYTPAQLDELVRLLDTADLVVPANAFDPLPWHARWDTARTLLNRAVSHDYPGTMGVRRSVVLAAGGYDGDVLFENLELIRTVRAAGGRITFAPRLIVRREPPDAQHFLTQRVRQAYDSLAQPGRLAVELSLAPVALTLARRRGWPALGMLAGAAILLAECGRRRDGGRRAYPPTASLFAPAWLAERAITSWLAVGCRLALGGVPYPGVGRLRRAATPQRVLERRLAARPSGR